MDIKELGFTKKELQDRVVDQIVERHLESIESGLDRRIQEVIKEKIDAAVVVVADKHLGGGFAKMIEDFVVQETNQWGEKKGKTMTFIEHIMSRAENYMKEEVDSSGRSPDECRRSGNSWYGSKTTRAAHLVHQHLHYRIEEAMKGVLKNANDSFAEGLEEAIKLKLDELRKQIGVKVNVGR